MMSELQPQKPENNNLRVCLSFISNHQRLQKLELSERKKWKYYTGFK